MVLLRPTMGKGGADRVTLNLIKGFDPDTFDISLVLFRAQGVLIEDLPKGTNLVSLEARSVWTAWGPLTRKLIQLEPDIVFSTSGGTNAIAVLARALGRGRYRLILSERNVLYHGGTTLKRRLSVLVKRLLYGSADSITTVSQGVKKDLVDILHIPPERVVVVYNPISVENITRLMNEPLEHPWFNQPVPIVLGAGRLVKEKNFENLIDAFALLRRKQVARLVILGDGDLAASLMGRVRKHALEDDVWFAGYDKNPFRYMSRCSVFVLSSRDEGLPGVLIQAMACGAAVISTDCHAGPGEIVTSGVDGLLVPVGDPEALASSIELCLRDDDLRRRLAETGRKTATDRFADSKILPLYYKALMISSKQTLESADVR